jgi:hypothetical protein
MREAGSRSVCEACIQVGREPKVFSGREQPVACTLDRTLMNPG